MTIMISAKLPLSLQSVLQVSLDIFALGVSLFAFHYYTPSVTLTIAVGSIESEAAHAISAIASRLPTTEASVRLKVVDPGTALEVSKMFAGGKADLAVVRGDVGDLSWR